MRVFAGTFAICVLTVVSFVFWMDPAGRWHRHPLRLAKNWKPDEVLVTPKDFEEMGFRFRHLELAGSPEVVVFGSSRILAAGAWLFGSGTSVINVSVSGASIEDHVTLWQYMKSRGQIPTWAVVQLDPWVFNDSADPIRWMSRFEQYVEFRRSTARGLISRILLEAELAYHRAEYVGLEFAELFSRPMLRSAVKLFALGDDPMAMMVVDKGQKPEESRAYGSDGSYYYPRSLEVDLPEDEIKQIVRSRVAGKDSYGLSNYSYSHFRFDLTAHLLADLRKSGVKVMLIAPPYHPEAMRLMRERSETMRALSNYHIALRELGDQEGAVVCDQVDPVALGCAESWFIDEMHMRRPCYSRLVRECFSKWPEWEPLLSRAD